MEQRENEENLEKVRAFSKPKCFPSPRPLSTSQWMINVNNETFRKKRTFYKKKNNETERGEEGEMEKEGIKEKEVKEEEIEGEGGE